MKIKDRYNRDDLLLEAIPSVKASDRLRIFKRYLQAKNPSLNTDEAVERVLAQNFTGDIFKRNHVLIRASDFRHWYQNSYLEMMHAEKAANAGKKKWDKSKKVLGGGENPKNRVQAFKSQAQASKKTAQSKKKAG